MFKRKIQKILFGFFAFILSFSLLGCKNEKKDSSSEPQIQSGESNYYNEKNFISSDKKIKETKLITYDGPTYLNSSSSINVKVEGVELFVYETRVNYERQFSWTTPTEVVPVVLFDFEGKVHVEVEVLNEDISSAKVSPQVYGIVPSFEKKTISFDLNYPGNYVLEYNDDSKKVLHIFAN